MLNLRCLRDRARAFVLVLEFLLEARTLRLSSSSLSAYEGIATLDSLTDLRLVIAALPLDDVFR